MKYFVFLVGVMCCFAEINATAQSKNMSNDINKKNMKNLGADAFVAAVTAQLKTEKPRHNSVKTFAIQNKVHNKTYSCAKNKANLKSFKQAGGW